MFQTSFSKADARDLLQGAALPEAPRLIFDSLANVDRLPFHLRAHIEFEYLGAKPLGNGSVSVRSANYALRFRVLSGRIISTRACTSTSSTAGPARPPRSSTISKE